jgi:hypothetical protein
MIEKSPHIGYLVENIFQKEVYYLGTILRILLQFVDHKEFLSHA